MKVTEIFDLGLKLAIANDPRGQKGVSDYLKSIKKEFENSKPKEKDYFDKDKLVNPYSDSRIHVDGGIKNVKRIMAGIDVGYGEVLLASQLGEREKTIDLVVAHHPIGMALAGLSSVMDLLVEVFTREGVPVHVAEKITEERMKEVGRNVHPINHYQIIDLAKLLKVNLINTHTITDNLVNKFLHEFIEKRDPKTIGDLLDVLLEIPEYQEGKRRGAGPNIVSGNSKSRVGRYLVEMTGGTNPSDKVYKELSRYGISTLVGMHMKDEAREKATEHHMNIVIAGHISSDSLGMNLFLDELEKKGIEIIPCGGFIRVSRVK